MARLTRKQTDRLTRVLYHLNRANGYINQSDVAVARKCSMATTTLHYVRPDGSALVSVDKQIGSDLTGLAEGIRELQNFLESEVRVSA